MVGLIFLFVLIAAVFALAMRRAPLWAWGLALLIAGFVWVGGLFISPDWIVPPSWLIPLVYFPGVSLLLLSIPSLRRRLIVAPAYQAIRGILPKVSDTEAQALDAGTIGFDAEMFSGRPDWAKLRAVPGIVLTPEERAFLDGPTEELCRMIDDWQVRHNQKEMPEPIWDFVKQHGFLGMLISKAARRTWLFGSGPIADPRQDRLALARTW